VVFYLWFLVVPAFSFFSLKFVVYKLISKILTIDTLYNEPELLKRTSEGDENDVPWMQLSALQGWEDPIASQYAVRGIPQNWLIDPNGKIIALNLRGDKIEKILKDLIK
jgi:hypothetical protein